MRGLPVEWSTGNLLSAHGGMAAERRTNDSGTGRCFPKGNYLCSPISSHALPGLGRPEAARVGAHCAEYSRSRGGVLPLFSPRQPLACIMFSSFSSQSQTAGTIFQYHRWECSSYSHGASPCTQTSAFLGRTHRMFLAGSPLEDQFIAEQLGKVLLLSKLRFPR